MKQLPIVIQTRTESKRGCGYRKPGGIYLVAAGVPMPCGKLPIPLTVCPTCSCGIKPSRGWTWIDADNIAAAKECYMPASACVGCPLAGGMGRAGLLWVGEKFYKTPGDWSAEAFRLGVSRRISQVPKELQVGKTWVLMAHRKVELEHGAKPVPAIFHAFRPSALEYVLAGDESEDDLRNLMKRGFTLVRVVRDDGKPLGAPTEDDDE